MKIIMEMLLNNNSTVIEFGRRFSIKFKVITNSVTII